MTFGDANGEVGDPMGVLDAEVLLFFFGRSGVRNEDSERGGGQD